MWLNSNACRCFLTHWRHSMLVRIARSRWRYALLWCYKLWAPSKHAYKADLWKVLWRSLWPRCPYRGQMNSLRCLPGSTSAGGQLYCRRLGHYVARDEYCISWCCVPIIYTYINNYICIYIYLRVWTIVRKVMRVNNSYILCVWLIWRHNDASMLCW